MDEHPPKTHAYIPYNHAHRHGYHLAIGLTFLILGAVAFFVVVGYAVRTCLMERAARRRQRREREGLELELKGRRREAGMGV